MVTADDYWEAAYRMERIAREKLQLQLQLPVTNNAPSAATSSAVVPPSSLSIESCDNSSDISTCNNALALSSPSPPLPLARNNDNHTATAAAAAAYSAIEKQKVRRRTLRLFRPQQEW
jgi:hypothetical protein